MHPDDSDWTIEELRRAIQKGLDDLDAGRASSGEEVFARLWERRRQAYTEMRRNAAMEDAPENPEKP